MDTDVSFRPMTDDEYEAWREASIASYARDLARAIHVDESVALDKAGQQVAQMLPEGLATANNHLLTVVARSDQGRIGSLWLRFAPESGDAFIADLVIDENRRGRGYGRGTMLAAERFAGELGASGLALHVFAHNARALHLYEDLGYAVTSQNMRKDIASL